MGQRRSLLHSARGGGRARRCGDGAVLLHPFQAERVREMTMQTVLQAEFATSLLSSSLPPPQGIVARPGADPERRFSVYRNNVVVGLVRALEGRFPVVRRLVGEESF